jgi:hypothetical protein
MTRDSLFDLAVERALSYTKSLNVSTQNKEGLKNHLELWYLKTRFAYRIPLDDIVEVLQRYPGQGTWSGGKDGSWHTP